jgi:hypothetical protein
MGVKMMNRFTIAGLLSMTFVLLGCLDSVQPPPKEDLVPVSGTVKLGGQPTEGILVSFVPTGSTTGQGAIAVTDSAGHYELVHNATKKPGTAAGDYVVELSKWVMPNGEPLPKDKAPHLVGAANVIPPRWAEQIPGGRGNEVKVLAGGTTRDFDIPK